MKLRNKKTGGLGNLIVDKDLLRVKTDAGWADYGSLAELNEEWEDYKPKEPLIGDELERKLVREWASVYVITTVWVIRIKDSCLIKLIDYDENHRSIVIDSYANIENGRYSIADLCGVEKE